ncbi:MAG: 4'-phosphopantetheinyl transferase superfamily protein [Planctomycetota bacterium]
MSPNLEPVLVLIPEVPTMSRPQRVNQQHAAARWALQQSAWRSGAPQSGWLQRDDGAPLPLETWHWSISHTQTLAAAVVADRPVGIDVERIRPRREELFDAIGHPAEWEILQNRTWRSFFQLWTAKEAVLKCHQLGIAYLKDARLVKRAGPRRLAIELRGETVTIEYLEWGEQVAAVTCFDARVVWHAQTCFT